MDADRQRKALPRLGRHQVAAGERDYVRVHMTGHSHLVDAMLGDMEKALDGGSFSVLLQDAVFGTPGSARVSGTFTYLSSSVPEPGTWAMMLLGFGAAGVALRRRRTPKFAQLT